MHYIFDNNVPKIDWRVLFARALPKSLFAVRFLIGFKPVAFDLHREILPKPISLFRNAIFHYPICDDKYIYSKKNGPYTSN